MIQYDELMGLHFVNILYLSELNALMNNYNEMLDVSKTNAVAATAV